ncbi:hypothetical protein D915_004877 [Fasciola hepatica]|uniref:Uncharacterized protein n=1 Tax=Fasciola hepatica TaxID=6192 RepID=A0A4E0RD55_FASHE|nr:hypothetical protein D915_004877 [Fasciola hepatica]
MHPMTKLVDQMRTNIPKVIEPSPAMTLNCPKPLRPNNISSSLKLCPSVSSSVLSTSHSLPSANTSSIDLVREETEWEQCSRNPDVARLVKTRNLIERNRLTAVRTQLDRELERELKRLAIVRKEFADVLDNLQRRRTESRQKNVRQSGKQCSLSTNAGYQKGKPDRLNRSGRWLPLPLNVKRDENRSDNNRQSSNGSTQSEIDRAGSHRGSLSSVMSLPELYRLASPQHLSVYQPLMKSYKSITRNASKLNLEVPKSLHACPRSLDSLSNETHPEENLLSSN